MQLRGSKQARLRRLSDARRVAVKFTSDFQPVLNIYIHIYMNVIRLLYARG